MSDFFDDIEGDLDQDLVDQQEARDADDWDPKEGTILKGVFLKVNGPIMTKYGSTWVALVKDLGTDKTINVWLSRKVLRTEMLDAAPKQGGEFAIRYVGERETQDGSNSYHLYQVRVPDGGSDPAYWTQALTGYEMDQTPTEDDDKPVPPDEAPF